VTGSAHQTARVLRKWEKSAPDYDRKIAGFEAGAFAGGREWIGTWPPVFVAQWVLERITIRAAGEHFTRRPLAEVVSAGFEIVEVERLKAGTIERVHARAPR
jgi:hypothetical protein